MSSSVTLWDVVMLKGEQILFVCLFFKVFNSFPKNISRLRLYPIFYGTSMRLPFKYLRRPKIAFGNLDYCKAVPTEEGAQANRLKLFCCHS